MFINPILCQISKSGLVTFLELFDMTRVIIFVLITVGEIKCLTLKTNLWDAFLSSKAVKDLNCHMLVSYVLLKIASDIQAYCCLFGYKGLWIWYFEGFFPLPILCNTWNCYTYLANRRQNLNILELNVSRLNFRHIWPMCPLSMRTGRRQVEEQIGSLAFLLLSKQSLKVSRSVFISVHFLMGNPVV